MIYAATYGLRACQCKWTAFVEPQNEPLHRIIGTNGGEDELSNASGSSNTSSEDTLVESTTTLVESSENGSETGEADSH